MAAPIPPMLKYSVVYNLLNFPPILIKYVSKFIVCKVLYFKAQYLLRLRSSLIIPFWCQSFFVFFLIFHVITIFSCGNHFKHLIESYILCLVMGVGKISGLTLLRRRDTHCRYSAFLSHLLVAGCDIGVRFSVRPSVCLSTFMSKFDIYVKVSILINYKTKQPSNLAGNISLTSWLCNIGIRISLRLSVRPSVCQHLCRSSTFMSKLVH